MGVIWASNELFDLLWKIGTEESYSKAIKIIEPLVKNDDPGALGRMGRAFRDGRGVQQDLLVAASYMRKSTMLNNGWAKNELFNIYWRIGNPDNDSEMISIISEFASTGDANAMGRLGRAYREGKGVEKDIIMAEYWLGKATEKHTGWVWEYINLLWRINTRESLVKIIDLVNEKIRSIDSTEG